MPREALQTRSIFHLFQNIVYFSPCLENGISQHVHDEALLLTYLPTYQSWVKRNCYFTCFEVFGDNPWI